MVEPITALVMAYIATAELNKIAPEPKYNKVMTKPIDKNFERKGYNYTLINRKDSICIYSYTRAETNRLAGYEVVKLYTDKTGHEYFPGTSLWGINGFTFLPEHITKAHAKFDKMYNDTLVKKAKKSK